MWICEKGTSGLKKEVLERFGASFGGGPNLGAGNWPENVGVSKGITLDRDFQRKRTLRTVSTSPGISTQADEKSEMILGNKFSGSADSGPESCQDFGFLREDLPGHTVGKGPAPSHGKTSLIPLGIHH